MPLPRQPCLALLLGSCACGTVTAASPPRASPTTRTVANETEVPEIGCCIATKVSGWTFDAPEGGGIVVVTYPFVLQGGTKD